MKDFGRTLVNVFTAGLRKGNPGRRVAMTVAGLVLISLSVALSKTIGWGVDPFSVFSFSIVELTGLSYTIIFSLECLILLSVTFVLRRELLGFSTLFMLFINGYLVDFFYGITSRIWASPDVLTKIALLVFDVVLTCVAASLYYASDLGVSPYDAQALTIGALTPVPFKYARIGTDIVCTLIGFVLLCAAKCETKYVYLNFGTLVFAFGMGPIIAWCRAHIAEPLLDGTFGKRR